MPKKLLQLQQDLGAVGYRQAVIAGESRLDRVVHARRWLPDLLGVAWVVLAAGALLAPTLAHGWSLGPFDQLARLGLTAKPGALPKAHNPQVVDLIREIIPWTSLAWSQVHHGHIPLWNPYSALGGPLSFNWQSATFSVPALVGYLVPVRLDFTVQVFVTFVIGGTGMYVLARTMRLGVIGAAMAATAFELSGAFQSVLGWPIASVMSWAGWMFACAILILRGRHRRRYVVLFALIFAASIYAGEPDALVVLVVALIVFFAVVLGLRARRYGGLRAVAQPVLDVVLGSAAGLGLAAPLVLPAAQLTAGSIRGTGRIKAFPAYQMVHLIFQTFDGSSLSPLLTFSNRGPGYVPPAGFIGVIAIVLAVLGIIKHGRRPAVLAFGLVVVVMGALVYLSPLVSFLNQLPGLGEVRWVRALQVLVFALAILAGVGLDVLARSRGSRSVRNWLGAGFAAMGLFLLGLWLFGRGQLPAVETAIRARSFRWPTAEVVVGLVVFGFLVAAGRRTRRTESGRPSLLGDPSRGGAVVLLISSTAFLVVLGAPWWTSNTTYLAPNKAEVSLQKTVGSSIVGFGTLSCWSAPGTLGIQPEVNIVYGVHEFDSYDPLSPQSLYKSWLLSAGQRPKPTGPYTVGLPFSLFCPIVKTTEAAKLYGIGYVLEPGGNPGPPGSIFDKKIGNEELYRIPGASVATLTPEPSDGSLPPVTASGTPVTVKYPDPASWKLTTRASRPQILRLRLTDVPGWHASIDGKPLTLIRFDRVMLQAKIPAGKHTIELHYWPESFTIGIVIGVGTAIVLVLALAFGGRWTRRHPRPSVATSSADL